MSDLPPSSLFDLAQGDDLRDEVASMARALAAAIADPRSLAPEHRPVSMSRRLAVVTAVSTAGGLLTADVELNGETIPGVSPQVTYRPVVGDLVWLEFQGTDLQISPPLATVANRAWTVATLGSGWATYLGGGWNSPVSYWRDRTGWVHMRGSAGGGAPGSTVTTLPAGHFSPVEFSAFSVYANDGTAPIAAGVSIDTAGVVRYHGPAAPLHIVLDSVHFRVD